MFHPDSPLTKPELRRSINRARHASAAVSNDARQRALDLLALSLLGFMKDAAYTTPHTCCWQHHSLLTTQQVLCVELHLLHVLP